MNITKHTRKQPKPQATNHTHCQNPTNMYLEITCANNKHTHNVQTVMFSQRSQITQMNIVQAVLAQFFSELHGASFFVDGQIRMAMITLPLTKNRAPLVVLHNVKWWNFLKMLFYGSTTMSGVVLQNTNQ